MAVGCYHADRVTGVFSLDSGPLDHRHYEAFREMKDVVKFAHELKLNRGRNEIELEIKEKILVWKKIGEKLKGFGLVPEMEKNSQPEPSQKF